MYGIVNKAIEDLVRENFGDEKWLAVKERSGIDIDFFVSNEPYNDEVTYKLAGAVSEEMNMPINEVLIAFGEWWVLRTGQEKYGSLMRAGGNSLKEFLINLPTFHNRVMLIYPKLMPPEFKVSDESDRSMLVHYYSQRLGLQEFVRGLLQGIGKIYDISVNVELVVSREDQRDHDTFRVSW